MNEKKLHYMDLFNTDLEAEIWRLSAEKRPGTAAELEERLSHYLNAEKKPSFEALQIEAGASEPGEFLRWCSGVDCVKEWRDVCREAYKKLRSKILNRLFWKLQKAKSNYIDAIEEYNQEWLRDEK